MLLKHFASLSFLLGLAVATVARGDSFELLLPKIPATANAVAIVHAEAIRQSQSAGGEALENAGLSVWLERVDWYLQAAELDFEYMHPIWEISVAYMPDRPTLEQVAARSGGRADRLAGSEAVERPNDSFVVAFGPRIIGAMSPANRQNVIRWVRQSKVKKTPDLTPYLAGAMAVAEQGPAEVVLAFDIAGLMAPEEVAQGLQKSPALTEAGVAEDVAAKVIASVVGARLEIALGTPRHGRLVFDCTEPTAALAKAARPLLLEILAKRGAKVEALSRWTASCEGQTIVLEGEMTSSGLRRVASILSGPVGPWSAATPEQSSESAPKSVMGQASQAYFQAVTGYLDDLFGDDVQPQSLYEARVWVERYAHKIQSLNTANVDPDVLSYASHVIMLLNEISSIAERAQMRTDVRDATMYYGGFSRYVRYGPYDYYEAPDVTRDRALVQADEASQGMAATRRIVDQLHRISNETRSTMTKRYGVQF